MDWVVCRYRRVLLTTHRRGCSSLVDELLNAGRVTKNQYSRACDYEPPGNVYRVHGAAGPYFKVLMTPVLIARLRLAVQLKLAYCGQQEVKILTADYAGSNSRNRYRVTAPSYIERGN